MYPPIIITPPTELPSTVAQLRRHLELPGQPSAGDTEMLEGMIAAATAAIESEIVGSLVKRRLQAAFPEAGDLRLYQGPVLSIVAAAGPLGPLDVTGLRIVRCGHAESVELAAGTPRPLTIDYEAGYATAAAVPADLRHAVLMLAATLFKHRESVATAKAEVVPHAFERFLARHRRVGYVQ